MKDLIEYVLDKLLYVALIVFVINLIMGAI